MRLNTPSPVARPLFLAIALALGSGAAHAADPASDAATNELLRQMSEQLGRQQAEIDSLRQQVDALLMEQRGRPMARDAIQRHLYGWSDDVASNAVDVHVHALRRKLDPAAIRTVRGIGYALGDLAGAAP